MVLLKKRFPAASIIIFFFFFQKMTKAVCLSQEKKRSFFYASHVKLLIKTTRTWNFEMQSLDFHVPYTTNELVPGTMKSKFDIR